MKTLDQQVLKHTSAVPQRRAVLAGLALPLLFITTGASAADVDFSDWACEACPFDGGYRAQISVGASHVSDDSAKFGDARGYEEQGAYANVDGAGVYTSDDYRLTWALEDLGLDSRGVAVDGGRPGSYDYYLDYREIPRYVYDTTATIFSAEGVNVLTEPAAWVDSGLTTGFTALSNSLRKQNIANERQRIALGGSYQPTSSRLKFTADYRHEQRDGNRIIGGSYYTQASLLPAVMGFQTDDVDLQVSYTGTDGEISVGYHAGWFRNNGWAVTWDNPFGAPAAAARGRLAQEPDNQYQNVSVSGSYRLDGYDTVVAASTVFGTIEQRDNLLPYTTNRLLSGNTLPRERLDGKVDTSHISLSLMTRPHKRARVSLTLKRDERDNKTPREQWQRVIVDSFDSRVLETNTPFSYQRMKYKLKTTLDLFDNIKLYGAVERTETDREFQEVAAQTEDETWGQLQWRPRPLWQISLKGGTSRREIDRYDTTAPVALGQNPLLRKYNLAYRFREYGSLSASAALPNIPVTVSTSIRFANDSYSKSVLGLLDSDEVSYSADLDWAINDKASVYINGGWDEIEAQQIGSESFGLPDWSATHKDEFFTASAGISAQDIAPNLDAVFDYTHTDGDSAISVDSASSGLNPFPDLESSLDALRLRFVYHKSERLTATVQVRYEHFSSTDWALAGVTPSAIPTVLSLGADPYNYNVLVFGVQFNYALGDDSGTLGQ